MPDKKLGQIKKDAWIFNFQASFVIFNIKEINILWIN